MKLNNPERFVDDSGHILCDVKNAIEILYNNGSLFEISLCDITEYNKSASIFDQKLLKEYEEKQPDLSWNFPEKYKNLDILKYLLNFCATEKEKQRIEYEVSVFINRGHENFLRCTIYLSDVLKENNLIWGCGRGSSVSSYCLYLLDIHLVDSIEFDLDFHEFIK